MADRVQEQVVPRGIGHPRQLALQHDPVRTAAAPSSGTGLSKGMARTSAAIPPAGMPGSVGVTSQVDSATSTTSGSLERHGEDHARSDFLSSERLASLQPRFGAIAHRLARALPRPQTVEFIESFAAPFAMQAQCVFLGQSPDIEAALRCWIRPCQARIFCGDEGRAGASPSELFQARLKSVLRARWASAALPPNDVLGALVSERVRGRGAGNRELLATLHAWTAGAVDETTRALRVLVRHLAEHPRLQADLRANPERLSRTVTAALQAAGHEIGSPVGLHWAFGEDARVRWMPRPSMPEDGADWQYRSSSGDDVRLWPDVLQAQLHEAICALLGRIDHFDPAPIRASRVGRCSMSRYPTLPLRIR